MDRVSQVLHAASLPPPEYLVSRTGPPNAQHVAALLWSMGCFEGDGSATAAGAKEEAAKAGWTYLRQSERGQPGSKRLRTGFRVPRLFVLVQTLLLAASKKHSFRKFLAGLARLLLHGPPVSYSGAFKLRGPVNRTGC